MDARAEKISDSEALVMKVVWEYEEPVPYSHIRTVLNRQMGWESPTINTLVNRLVKKEVLKQEKREVYYYTPLLSEETYTEAKTKSFLEKVYGGSAKGLMNALLSCGDLTSEDLDELRKQWNS